MINLEHIRKSYHVGTQPLTALDDVSLSISAGEIVGVIGPSGAGKSTLVRCVNLLERPTSGRVIIDGCNMCDLNASELRAARRKIGMIFQGFNLLSSCNVYDNVALPLRIANASKQDIDRAVIPMLELTGIRDRATHYPSELSGGQKQRVAISRALVNKPTILLSDEATSSLDPRTTHSILQLLKEINQRLNLTILMITHEMDVAKEICHHLAIMEQGRIIENATVIDFFTNPKTALAKSFINKQVKQKLPESVVMRLVDKPSAHAHPLWHLSFLGQTAQEPLISQLVKQFHMSINILQADIEPIRDQIIGTMVVEAIANNEQELNNALALLKSKGVHVETIGYVTTQSSGAA